MNQERGYLKYLSARLTERAQIEDVEKALLVSKVGHTGGDRPLCIAVGILEESIREYIAVRAGSARRRAVSCQSAGDRELAAAS